MMGYCNVTNEVENHPLPMSSGSKISANIVKEGQAPPYTQNLDRKVDNCSASTDTGLKRWMRLHFSQARLLLCLDRSQVGKFIIGEQPRSGHESQTERDLQRETGTATFRDIDGQVGVLPVFELIRGHVEGTPVNFSQLYVPGSNHEITLGKAHGGGTVTAPPTLVKHQFPMLFAQAIDNLRSLVGYRNTFTERGFAHYLLLK
jgi:hypothetical protein